MKIISFLCFLSAVFCFSGAVTAASNPDCFQGWLSKSSPSGVENPDITEYLAWMTQIKANVPDFKTFHPTEDAFEAYRKVLYKWQEDGYMSQTLAYLSESENFDSLDLYMFLSDKSVSTDKEPSSDRLAYAGPRPDQIDDVDRQIGPRREFFSIGSPKDGVFILHHGFVVQVYPETAYLEVNSVEEFIQNSGNQAK